MYKDITHFMGTCESCQVHSNIHHRDELQLTYPLTIHFKWMVDLVSMSMGVGQMKYLVLAREDLTNQVEGRTLANKTTAGVCKFLLEDVICRYRCVGNIVADKGELNAHEAIEIFERLGVKLSLAISYNLEENGNIERRHGPIVKAIVRACDGRVRNWPRLLPYALWANRTTHSSCYRLGTLTYPLSFELGVKVTVWHERGHYGLLSPYNVDVDQDFLRQYLATTRINKWHRDQRRQVLNYAKGRRLAIQKLQHPLRVLFLV